MSQTHVSTATRRTSLIVAAALVAIAAFGYRFTSFNGLTNDHFVHLARAQAMLAGDLPIRDYTEEGVPLTVLLSAGAQVLLGQSLFAEMVLVLTSLSVAAGVTCWLTSRLTSSLTLGVGAAALQVLIYPRLYSHPKLLLYSIFLLIVWWYLQGPGRRGALVLALWTALSFLIRHDHGVYIGLSAGVVILVAFWREGIARVTREGLAYGILTLLCVAPYFVYVQYQQGIIDYFRTGLATSSSEASRTRIGRLSFDPQPAGTWVALAPADPAGFPGIRVRWKADVDDRRRQALERELRLLSAEFAEKRTWQYRIEPPGRATLSQLVTRDEVEDTSGFNRSSLRFDQNPGLLRQFVSATKLDRLARIEAGPRLAGLFSQHNVAVVFFFVIWILPAVAVWLAIKTPGASRASPAFTIALSALVAISAAGLLRDSLAQRTPDLFGSLPILVACVVAAGWRNRPLGPAARIAAGTAIAVFSSGFVVGTLVLGDTPSRINQTTILKGPRAVWERAQTVFRHVHEWPWSNAWPAGHGWKVARYVHDCTRPGDRLLVTWSAPEFNVFSRRVFAGGETALFPVFRQPREYEPSLIARLSRQSVPILLVNPEARDDFHRTYPALSKYLDDRYRKAGEFTSDERKIDVYVDTSRPQTGRDREFGWPCFATVS